MKRYFGGNLSCFALALVICVASSSCKKDSAIDGSESDDSTTIVIHDTLYIHDTTFSVKTLPSFILAGQTTGQGVKYTDNINDTLMALGQYSKDSSFIDVDGDGFYDFRFGLTSNNAPGFTQIFHSIIANNSFSELICDSSNVVPLDLSDTIGVYPVFGQCSNIYSYTHFNPPPSTTYEGGLWKNTGYKYVGFRLIKNQQIFYGWIGVEWISQTQYVIHDYAITEPF